MIKPQNVPVLRALHRYYREITRPAPLAEFTDYDSYWQARVRDGKRATVLDRHRIIAKLLPDEVSVLDIGCGDGAFLRYLRSNKPRCRLMGADVSAVAIEELRKLGIPGQVINENQPLDEQIDGTHEIVVLMEVIEHIVDAEKLMRQVIALQPKRIFVTIPNVGFLLHRLRLMFGGRFPITTIIYHMKEHVRFWTVKDFYQWTTALGMKILSHHGQVDRPDRFLIWLIRRAPSLFADKMVYELSIEEHAYPIPKGNRH